MSGVLMYCHESMHLCVLEHACWISMPFLSSGAPLARQASANARRSSWMLLMPASRNGIVCTSPLSSIKALMGLVGLAVERPRVPSISPHAAPYSSPSAVSISSPLLDLLWPLALRPEGFRQQQHKRKQQIATVVPPPTSTHNPVPSPICALRLSFRSLLS